MTGKGVWGKLLAPDETLPTCWAACQQKPTGSPAAAHQNHLEGLLNTWWTPPRVWVSRTTSNKFPGGAAGPGAPLWKTLLKRLLSTYRNSSCLPSCVEELGMLSVRPSGWHLVAGEASSTKPFRSCARADTSARLSHLSGEEIPWGSEWWVGRHLVMGEKRNSPARGHGKLQLCSWHLSFWGLLLFRSFVHQRCPPPRFISFQSNEANRPQEWPSGRRKKKPKQNKS